MKTIVKPITLSRELLPAGEKLIIPSHSIKMQKHLSFTADLDELGDGKIYVGHGIEDSSASWVEIDSKEIKAFSFYSYTDPKHRPLFDGTVEHGMKIADSISVIIDIYPDEQTAFVILSTPSGMIKVPLKSWDGSYGEIMAYAEGCDLKNCKLNWSSDCFARKIWILGDSYSGIGHLGRWPAYLYRDGFHYHMISGYPGMPAEKAIEEFRRYVEIATPEFAVWTLGMNNPDRDGKISAGYLASTEEFIEICNARGITPILSTIPNVPERDNKPKNAWVRSLPYRYIDFNHAVGADKNPEWYEGMLSSDRVHPTNKGAAALYARVLCDFPEIMQSSNT